MKYLSKTGLPVLLYIFFTAVTGTASAQDNFYNWQLGLGIGYTNYYGDVSNYQINNIGKLSHLVEYNKYYQHQPSYSLLLQKRLTPTLGFLIQANVLQFEMSDRFRKNNGSFDTAATNYARSLNFRTSMQDVGIAFSFNANNGKFFSRTAFFYPSFYIGAGVSSFTVKGDLYDKSGNPYNYRLPGDITDGNFETNLRDLRTETDDRYSNIVPYADLGLGLHFRFSDYITLSVNSDIKYSASDYLDDVSGRYKTTYTTPQQAYAAKPGYNVVNPLTLKRGDDNSMNDFYINNRVVLNIALGTGKKNNARPFVSPVIYSLSAPYNYQKVKNDSVARMASRNDSLMKIRMDALVKFKADSLHAMQDSMARLVKDTGVQKQLQNINAELANIQYMLKMQQSTPRLQQLQYQEDSVKALRDRLAKRPATREDQLRLRIYDLQSDSIRHEMEKVRAGSSQYPSANDSVLYRPFQPSNSNAVQQSMPAETMNITDQGDSISEAELKSFNTDISNLKKDKRYKTSPIFKNDVDSMQRKVNAYPVKTRNTKGSKVQQQPLQLSNTTNAADQARMDSLQQQLNLLQNKMNNGTPVNNLNETAAPQQTIRDTVYSNRDVDQLQSRLQQNTDSLNMLQRRLKQSNDSAAYFRRAAFAASEPVVAEAAPKRKWYQVFGTGKRKQQAVVTSNNQVVTQQQLQRTQDSVAFYQSNQKSLSDADQKAAQQRYNNMQRQLKRTQDSMAYYQKVLASPAVTDQQAAAAPKRKWYQIFNSKKRKQQNAAVTNTDQQVAQQRYNDMQSQLKRTQDSMAYYQSVAAQPIVTDQATAAPKRKWYQIFGSRKRNKKVTDQQLNSVAYTNQQYNDRQQQYYNDETSRLQRDVDDLNRRNRDLADQYSRLQADRDRTRSSNLSTSPIIITDGTNDPNRPSVRNSELLATRAELDRMKLLDYETQRSAVSSSYIPATVVQPVVAGDTANINALRSEINQLRNELNAIKGARPAVSDTVRTDRNFDVNSFPVISVYFATGAVTLSQDQISKISRFAQVATGNASAGVSLKGFTDPVGNAVTNEALARKRTAYVMSLLINRYKVAENRIVADEPTVTAGGKIKKPNPLDRRVDLEFR